MGPPPRTDALIGRVIAERFRVEAFLDVGAVGAVYRATDLQHGRPVAVKIWNSHAVNEQTRGRFAREASALSQLQHPNIVDVYSCGVIDDLPYVVIEYLDGESLSARLAGGGLDPESCLSVARQMLDALAYAHRMGVVHRDLKPDNVFLTRAQDGALRVKLLDFGLAKFLEPDADPVKGVALTVTGMVMGTPRYMAPEQASGKAVDARADVYSAGCVMFELCAGRPPYLGETNLELFRAHTMAKVPQLAELRPDAVVAPELQALLERALAKKPAERFPSATEMLAALQALPARPLRVRRISGPLVAIGAAAGKGSAALRAAVSALCFAALAALAYVVLRQLGR